MEGRQRSLCNYRYYGSIIHLSYILVYHCYLVKCLKSNWRKLMTWRIMAQIIHLYYYGVAIFYINNKWYYWYAIIIWIRDVCVWYCADVRRTTHKGDVKFNQINIQYLFRCHHFHKIRIINNTISIKISLTNHLINLLIR